MSNEIQLPSKLDRIAALERKKREYHNAGGFDGPYGDLLRKVVADLRELGSDEKTQAITPVGTGKEIERSGTLSLRSPDRTTYQSNGALAINDSRKSLNGLTVKPAGSDKEIESSVTQSPNAPESIINQSPGEHETNNARKKLNGLMELSGIALISILIAGILLLEIGEQLFTVIIVCLIFAVIIGAVLAFITGITWLVNGANRLLRQITRPKKETDYYPNDRRPSTQPQPRDRNSISPNGKNKKPNNLATQTPTHNKPSREQIQMFVRRLGPRFSPFFEKCDSLPEMLLLDAMIKAWDLEPEIGQLTGKYAVRQQYPITGGYRLDFLINSSLNVEVDGLAFHCIPSNYQRDRKRDQFIILKNILPLRFYADQIIHEAEYTIGIIEKAVCIKDV